MPFPFLFVAACSRSAQAEGIPAGLRPSIVFRAGGTSARYDFGLLDEHAASM
jgi:hypothetical protein